VFQLALHFLRVLGISLLGQSIGVVVEVFDAMGDVIHNFSFRNPARSRRVPSAKRSATSGRAGQGAIYARLLSGGKSDLPSARSI
jgi:hypothetical protein